jgi:hypothetical protein
MKLRSKNLLIAFVFLSVSMSLATPVSSASGSSSLKSKARLHSVAGVKEVQSLPQASPAGVFAEYASAASDPPDGTCGFSSPCYSTIRAPEPQSLFLVGSGLVAMAGIIRRRVAR